MYLYVSKSKDPHFYIMKGERIKGKGTTTKVHLNLGTASEIKEKYACADALTWAKMKLKEINEALKAEKEVIMIPYRPDADIKEGSWKTVHCGHLPLLPTYNKLGLKAFSNEVAKRHKFEYDFEDILKKLVMGRILFPDSKRATMETVADFVDGADFSLDHIYKFLSLLAKEIEPMQRCIFEASRNALNRRTGVIYYDCTNYYFEIEKEDAFRKYGKSKEHRPNPIVQMGMFMDSDGLPLAFCINPGNTSEQQTLQPLEEVLANQFNLSEFVVCTDAGLASMSNRLYNTTEGRNYIVTQSIPSLPGFMKDWALERTGWKKLGEKENILYDLDTLDLSRHKEDLFYRERWFICDRSNCKDYEERLIVTFSPKYALYQKQLRDEQIARALKLIERKSDKSRQTQQDVRRFIHTTNVTEHGEAADKTVLSLNEAQIAKEAELDGLNCIATKLNDSIFEVLRANGFRYEIENLFRVSKTEFDARPVYLQREDRIRSHFAVCFVALLTLKAFQKEINEGLDKDERYSTERIINALNGMDYRQVKGVGYIPAYSATKLRTRCCEKSNVLINKEIVKPRKMREYYKC